MNRSLLRTKLFRPTLPDDFVLRPRLRDVLDSGLARKIILITAPAGFGKSSLAASWLNHLDESRAPDSPCTSWLSISESDNDLATFWAYLAAAIESAFPGTCAATQELLTSNVPLASAPLADMLAIECQDLPGQLVLAIDDFYLITNAGIIEALMRWIENLPTTVHVLLISRADPGAGISRLRARQQLCEVRMRDLQFSTDETATLLAASFARPIPSDFSQAVHEHTEGWAAGLRLAAISLHDCVDLNEATRALDLNNNRYIGDYLTDEVLNAQPRDVQDFLIRTSALPRMCAGLCAAVMAEADSHHCQRILEDLDRRNVFLVTLDDHRGWYRYHHQFQSLLQQHRERLPGMPGVDEDKRRAAGWFAANGFIDDALAAYVALGDYDRAEALVTATLPDLQIRESWHQLSHMLDSFPSAEIDRRPGLLVARACAQRMLFRESDVTPWAGKAEAILDANPDGWSQDHVQAWRGAIDVLRCLSDTGITPAQTVTLAECAMARLPKDQHWARAMALSRVSFGMIGMRRTEEALSLLGQAAANVPHDNDIVRMRLYYAIAVIQALTGTTASSLEWAQRAADLAVARAQEIGLLNSVVA